VKVRVAGLTLVFVLALVIPTTASAFTSVPAFRSALQRRINHFRAEYGRAPIHLNLRLEHSAQAHSNDMAIHHDFSHASSNGTSWAARIRYYGYRGGWIGENLAVGNVTARTVMAMWKASPPHRANLLNGHFRGVGIGAHSGKYAGRAAYYITSDFGG
jgi:uncharacterized protein YkwD